MAPVFKLQASSLMPSSLKPQASSLQPSNPQSSSPQASNPQARVHLTFKPIKVGLTVPLGLLSLRAVMVAVEARVGWWAEFFLWARVVHGKMHPGRVDSTLVHLEATRFAAIPSPAATILTVYSGANDIVLHFCFIFSPGFGDAVLRDPLRRRTAGSLTESVVIDIHADSDVDAGSDISMTELEVPSKIGGWSSALPGNEKKRNQSVRMWVAIETPGVPAPGETFTAVLTHVRSMEIGNELRIYAPLIKPVKRRHVGPPYVSQFPKGKLFCSIYCRVFAMRERSRRITWIHIFFTMHDIDVPFCFLLAASSQLSAAVVDTVDQALCCGNSV
ncbi:hypothetical protein C8R44DRAFT_857757 [Mycena epipterygia]|nr:hypothetical protein C8R44DRAFT_857757 [Mycena epipterygia]